jgi:hypothetical protein
VFRFSLQLLCKSFLVLRRIQRDIVINVKTSSCTVPVILVGFQATLNFLDRFSKKAQTPSFMKRHAPAALPQRKRSGTHCIGGWVGPRAGMDRCGKRRPHRDSIPGPSSPYRVAMPTELSRPTQMLHTHIRLNTTTGQQMLATFKQQCPF